MKKRLLSIMLAVTMISAPMPSMVYAAEDGWVSVNECAVEGTEELSTDSFVSESVEKSSEEITELCPHGNDRPLARNVQGAQLLIQALRGNSPVILRKSM